MAQKVPPMLSLLGGSLGLAMSQAVHSRKFACTARLQGICIGFEVCEVLLYYCMYIWIVCALNRAAIRVCRLAAQHQAAREQGNLSGELGAYLKSLKTRKDSLRRAQDREVLPEPLP